MMDGKLLAKETPKNCIEVKYGMRGKFCSFCSPPQLTASQPANTLAKIAADAYAD